MVKKVKLIIFPGNFLPNIGGLETHVDEFVKYLSKDLDYKITIFTPNTSNVKKKEVIYNNVKVIRYPAFFLVSNFPFPKFWSKEFRVLWKEIKKQKFDIVMSRTRFFTNSFMGLIFAKFKFKKLNRMKFVHVEHGSGYVKVESKITNFISFMYDQIIGRLIFKFSDVNVSISKAVWEFVNKFDKRKSPIIPRGVDFEIYKKKSNFDLSKFNLDLDKINICFVGRLYKWKGVENSIKAFEQLPKDVLDKVNFIIAGDGEDYSRLKLVAGKNLDKSIFMLGFVEFKNAISILKQSDIYIHSAYQGGDRKSVV